jgi:hypothetical protein
MEYMQEGTVRQLDPLLSGYLPARVQTFVFCVCRAAQLPSPVIYSIQNISFGHAPTSKTTVLLQARGQGFFFKCFKCPAHVPKEGETAGKKLHWPQRINNIQISDQDICTSAPALWLITIPLPSRLRDPAPTCFCELLSRSIPLLSTELQPCRSVPCLQGTLVTGLLSK